MLKSKGLLYVLFPIVIFIWGLVIYRIVEAFSDKTDPVIEFNLPEQEVFKKEIRDTFSLLPIEQDPFLGTYYKKPVAIRSKVMPPKEIVVWPEISYLGQISDAGKSSSIHIFQLQGKQVLLEKGDIVNGIKFINSTPQGVILSFQNVRKQYSKAL